MLDKISHPKNGLPEAIFESFIHLVPFVACELIVTDRKGGILLTRRDDKYWRGWHIPGGLLRYGESFHKRLNATALRELGRRVVDFRFLMAHNHGVGARSHDVSLLFLCRLSGAPKDGEFFKTPPRDTITEHRKIWKQITGLIDGSSRR